MTAGSEATRPVLADLADVAARTAYAALEQKSPQRTAFSGLAVADAACAAYGLRGRLAGVAGAAGAWRAGLVVFEKRRGPFRVGALPPLVLYVAPLLDGPPDEAETLLRRSPLDALLALVGRHFHAAALLLPPVWADVRPFAWAGWRLAPRYTYLGRLGAEPSEGWSKTRRWIARKHDADFRVEEDPRHAATALALMAASYRRKRAPFAVAPDATAAFVRAVAATGAVRAFAAFPVGGSDAVAAAAVLCDGPHAHYWLAGAAPGPASTALLAAALPRLHADGLAKMDWLGANVPGVAAFKRSFGGALALGFEARLVRHPALRLLGRLRG